jgi:acetyltransferase-like isoleucine patch superfamily enzyme
MFKYLIGIFLNLFNPAVSIFCLIDNISKVDRKAKIWRHAKIFRSSIGPYTYIGKRTNIICTNIGKYCSIAGNCTIGMGTHPLRNLSTSSLFISKNNATGHSWVENSSFQEYHHTNIGNDVWIGTGVLVIGGISIGDGAVIGAGSIVTKDIPPYAIAVGCPARVIKYRFEQPVIKKILEVNWWNLPEEKLKNKITVFQKESLSLVDIDSLLD